VLSQPLQMNYCWSIDFMSDVLSHGTKLRTLNVIDDYNREALLVEPSYSLPAVRVTRLLDQVAALRGYPELIRVDHGPEFESNEFKTWAKERNILIHYIQPGEPAQNGFVERFNRTYREDVLDMNLFSSLREVKLITREWLTMYNEGRPHESLAGLAPTQFAKMREQLLVGNLGNSTFN
jgi:putative transposase